MSLPQELNFMYDSSFRRFWGWLLTEFDNEYGVDDKDMPLRVHQHIPEMDNIEIVFWLWGWAPVKLQEYRRKYLRLSDDP